MSENAVENFSFSRKPRIRIPAMTKGVVRLTTRDPLRVGQTVIHHFPVQDAIGPVFLTAHGMWEGDWVFSKLETHFNVARCDIASVNFRGHHHGNEVDNIGKVSIADYTEDLAGAAAYFTSQGRKVVLVGHSMGGLIAQTVAEMNLPGVIGQVLVASAPPAGIFLRGSVLWRMLRLRYLEAMFCNEPIMITQKDAQALELNESEDAGGIYHRLCPESGRAAREIVMWKVKVDANKVKIPTLTLAARNDRMITYDVQKAIYAKYGDSATMTTFDGDHMFLYHGKTAPRVASEILGFGLRVSGHRK